MIRRLFIANRGEIAVRIIRTARRLGITSILAVSAADASAAPARLADECVPIGPGAVSQSYLSIDRLVRAAREAQSDALHPGYGFLSENAAFARAVAAAGIRFVGPDPSSLEDMGDKLRARQLAVEAGLPVVPGGEASDASALRALASSVGYPLLLKAVAGGGGRGMKRVDRQEDLHGQLQLAMAEAQASFGDPRIYLERFIARGRHVEVQLLGDAQRVVHLGTRDCSIQRRFQKLVEEAPAPGLPAPVLEQLTAAAVKLAERLHYRSAGTVEFLLDTATFEFYFLEMNARIQVEHPVTEVVTGIDLVEQQLLIADDQPLTLNQESVRLQGHAIEVRINAEDWRRGFAPSPGRVTAARWPAGRGIRVDSHIGDGSMIPPLYDSLIGKLIVSGAHREQAIERLRAALAVLELTGVSTTTELHRRIARDPRFVQGGVDTRFFEGLNLV
jgi:acetyl-CoA carboxylase biotin carboxylase subunit